jgi:hypothetical protein
MFMYILICIFSYLFINNSFVNSDYVTSNVKISDESRFENLWKEAVMT